MDKLQTICRRYRQYTERRDPERDRPRRFLRHYYDLYKLLELPRVREFIGTPGYVAYRELKLRGGADRNTFESRLPFELPDEDVLREFDAEFEALSGLFFTPAPTFADIIGEIRRHARRL